MEQITGYLKQTKPASSLSPESWDLLGQLISSDDHDVILLNGKEIEVGLVKEALNLDQVRPEHIDLARINFAVWIRFVHTFIFICPIFVAVSFSLFSFSYNTWIFELPTTNIHAKCCHH